MHFVLLLLLSVPMQLSAAEISNGAALDTLEEGLAPGASWKWSKFSATAKDLEARIPDHLWWGQIFEARYGTPDKLPGQVTARDGHGHATIWTGHYLAAEAYRYAVARYNREYARHHDSAQKWKDEMAQARERVQAIVQGLHRNANISENWSTPLVPGEAGILMRTTTPVNDPLGDGARECERCFFPIPWRDGKDYLIETNTSRDQYTGAVFGLLAAFDLVGADDPHLRARIRDDIYTMVGYLVRHQWWVIEPQTTRTDPNLQSKPLFVYNPAGQLHMAQAARHVAKVAGSAADRAKWEAVWQQVVAFAKSPLTPELAAQLGLPSFLIGLPLLQVEFIANMHEPHRSYYKFNLDHLRAFDYIRLERNLDDWQFFRNAFSIVDTTTKDDGNAHFEILTYALTGESPRRHLAFENLARWLKYWDRWGEAVTNSVRCGVELECIPEDQTIIEQKIGGAWVTVQVRPGVSPKLRSTRLLRIADERPHEDFLWQRSPYAGSAGLDHAARPLDSPPTVDFLLPYWMLRYFSEAEHPAYAPLPEWHQRSR